LKARGEVLLEMIVDAQGRVDDIWTVESTNPWLERAAITAVEQWRFEPAQNKEGLRCYTMLALEKEFVPRGCGFVPLSAEARQILRAIERGGEGISTARQLDAPLEARVMRAPVYPTGLREKGSAGEALIEFCLDKNGDAELPRIVSATVPEFGYAAAQAVATWLFKKPLRWGKPTVVRMQVPTTFAARG